MSLSTSTFAASFSTPPASPSALQRQFDGERERIRKTQKIVNGKNECTKRKTQLDQSFKDAMKKGGTPKGNMSGRSLFSNTSVQSMTPQQTGKKIHFIPSSTFRNVHYELTDSPSVKFEKRWKNFSDSMQ